MLLLLSDVISMSVSLSSKLSISSLLLSEVSSFATFFLDTRLVAAAGNTVTGFLPSIMHSPLLQLDFKISWQTGHCFKPMARHLGYWQRHCDLHLRNVSFASSFFFSASSLDLACCSFLSSISFSMSRTFFAFIEPFTWVIYVFFFESLGFTFWIVMKPGISFNCILFLWSSSIIPIAWLNFSSQYWADPRLLYFW